MPAEVYRDAGGKWRERGHRLKPGDPCPGSAYWGSEWLELVFREFATLKAFPGYAATLGDRDARLVDALTVLEWERQLVVNWLEAREENRTRG